MSDDLSDFEAEQVFRDDEGGWDIGSVPVSADSFLARELAAPLPGNLRRGQNLFNRLQELRPDLAELLRGGECDPFYTDERIPLFATWLRCSWDSTSGQEPDQPGIDLSPDAQRCRLGMVYRTIREAARLSMGDVARRAGCAVTEVSDFELGGPRRHDGLTSAFWHGHGGQADATQDIVAPVVVESEGTVREPRFGDRLRAEGPKNGLLPLDDLARAIDADAAILTDRLGEMERRVEDAEVELASLREQVRAAIYTHTADQDGGMLYSNGRAERADDERRIARVRVELGDRILEAVEELRHSVADMPASHEADELVEKDVLDVEPFLARLDAILGAPAGVTVADLAPAIDATPSIQWQPIATAPADTLVLVGWHDANGRPGQTERTDFDVLEEGACWREHAETVEFAEAVAPRDADIPCKMPPQQAPYTHWIQLPPVPGAPSAAEEIP